MAITIKELSLIAELHYGKLPDAFKDRAAEFFDALDQDGDGGVTLPELLNSNLEGKFGQEFLQHVFYHLDEEGKGWLEFRECLTLYYLCMYSGRTCAACQKNIPQGLGYSCLRCWKEGKPSNNVFSVCLECFSSLNYQHEHGPLHLLHDFVLFDNLLHSKSSSPTASPLAPIRTVEQTMKQCIVCGDYHESGIRGFTCDVHMSKMRGSNELVCEWCFSYMCSKCGNLFRDSSTRAEPGKWLQRFVCPSCHQRNSTTDCYDASLMRLQRALSGAELVRQCKTCEIKQRNGTLFWIVNGTNTALPSAAPQAQPWAPPPPPTRSRSSSLDHQPQLHPSNNSFGGSDGSYRGSAGYNDGSFRPGRPGDGSSHASSSRSNGSSHGGSSHGPRVNPVHQVPSPQGSGHLNRPNRNDSAAAAARAVNRMVKIAGRAANNMLNAGGGVSGGGGGGGNVFNAGDGTGAGTVNISISDGIGSGSDGGGYINGGDAGNGGIDPASLLASIGSFMGGGGDVGNGSGGIDAVSMLASFGSVVGGGGDVGNGSGGIDAVSMLTSFGSVVGGINSGS